MDRKEIIKFCIENLAFLSTEQLKAIKEAVDAKLKTYSNDD